MSARRRRSAALARQRHAPREYATPPLDEAAIASLAAPSHRPDATRVPQLVITLNATRDGLQAELPGANGLRRVVALRPGESFHDACLRILRAQAESHVEIGLDGAPTQAQVRHWERHSQRFPEAACRFCQHAGWTSGHTRRDTTRPRAIDLGDGITVRRLASKRELAAARVRPTSTRLLVDLADIGL